MRVGLDLTCLRGEFGGMAWQAWWLARWMPELAPNDTFVFFLPSGTAPPVETANVEVVRVTAPRFRGSRLLTEQWFLPRAAARARLDLLHTIAFGPPILYRGLKLLTMHDLGFKLYPETVPPRFARYWNWAYGPAALSCRHLIAVSEGTRSDIVRLLGRKPEEISVVPCGIDTVYLQPAPSAESKAVVQVPGPYLLHVGVLQPRKDLDTLFRSFALIQASRPELSLVVCGPPGWGYPDVRGLAARYGIGQRVHFISGLPQTLMPALYREATLLLFTSIHEGFGLPLLEAMASGTPVVATNSPAIPEVTGGAASLAPAGDAAALAAAALLLLDDPVRHADLARRGRARAAEFSWQRSAALTLAVYRGMVAR